MTDEIEQLGDGLYLNLPANIYHGQRRLSSSRIKDILISPATFWARSWMNPDLIKPDKEHFKVGDCYHTARLEPDMLDARFVRAVEKADFPDAPTTQTAIKALLKEMGHPATKSGETVLGAALRLKEAGFDGDLYHIELDKQEQALNGRQIIKADDWAAIQKDMALLERNAEVNQFLKGGAAEVSFLWTQDGVKFQVRFDYLAVRHWSDLKTFVNSKENSLNQCIINAIRFRRYYIQWHLYWTAAEIIRTGDYPIFNCGDVDCETGELSLLPVISSHLISEIRKQKKPFEAWFIFQEKGGIPNLLARQIEIYRQDGNAPDGKTVQHSLLMQKAKIETDHAVKLFGQCMEIFGDEPWQSMEPVGTITDDDFPPWFLEGNY